MVVSPVSYTSLLLPVFYGVVVHLPFPFSSRNALPSSHNKIGGAYKKNGGNILASDEVVDFFLHQQSSKSRKGQTADRLTLEDSALHAWHIVTVTSASFFCSKRLFPDCCLFLLLVLKVLTGLLLSGAVVYKLVGEGSFSCPFYIPTLNHMWVISGRFSS